MLDKTYLIFENLGERHAIDPAQLDTCSNAARVRLDAHHTAPVEFQMESEGVARTYALEWVPVDNKLKRSYLNADDAKRDGAYAIALAAVDELKELVGVARCETRTGADYYVAPASSNPDDLEEAFRLEVSGSDSDETQVRYWLKQKQQQAREGKAPQCQRQPPGTQMPVGQETSL